MRFKTFEILIESSKKKKSKIKSYIMFTQIKRVHSLKEIKLIIGLFLESKFILNYLNEFIKIYTLVFSFRKDLYIKKSNKLLND